MKNKKSRLERHSECIHYMGTEPNHKIHSTLLRNNTDLCCCLCDIAHAIVNGHIAITDAEKKELRKCRDCIRHLSNEFWKRNKNPKSFLVKNPQVASTLSKFIKHKNE